MQSGLIPMIHAQDIHALVTSGESVPSLMSDSSNNEVHSSLIPSQPTTINSINIWWQRPQVKLLWWHHCLRHCSFKMLNELEKCGEIPKPLINVHPSKCAGCLFGALAQKAWQKMGANNKPIKVAMPPGECVSVDQMISTQVGFIAQSKGRLICK